MKDFQFHSYGSDKITSYHRNVFGRFELSFTHLINNEDNLLFEIDFTDSNQDTIYQLESSKSISADFNGNFSIGRNSIHLDTNLQTWSSRHPNLYDLKINVSDSDNKTDTTFSEIVGIRDLYWVENDLIINQEDSILKAFELDTVLLNLNTIHKAKSVFANSILFDYLPSKVVVEKCDSLGIYVLINTKTLKIGQNLNKFLDENHNSPSLIAFYKYNDNKHPDSIGNVLKRYRNFLLLDSKPENIILSPFKISELNEDRIQILRRKFNPFKFDINFSNDNSIAVKINTKDFGYFFNEFIFEAYFHDLEGFNFDSLKLNTYSYSGKKLELNVEIPDNVSLSELSKVELVIYPPYDNYWFEKVFPIFKIDIY